MAASLSASEPVPAVARMAARACPRAVLTAGSVSLARAASTGPCAFASRAWKAVSAAALRPVGRQQIEPADRGADLRADGVVEAHLLEVALRHAIGLGPGGGLLEPVRGVAVIDPVRAGVEEEAAVR